jgi:uncharacterized protein
VIYEWDPAKAARNAKKHGVTFTEAASVFLDPNAITFQDPDHSVNEERFLTFGYSGHNRLLVVYHTEIADDQVRIIGARRATKREQHGYEEKGSR